MAEASLRSPGCEILLLEDDALLRKRIAAHLGASGAEISELSLAQSDHEGTRFNLSGPLKAAG